MASKKTNKFPLEDEKTQLLGLAEDRFGKSFFEKLDKLTESISEKDETINYTLTTNYEGAFYAYAE